MRGYIPDRGGMGEATSASKGTQPRDIKRMSRRGTEPEFGKVGKGLECHIPKRRPHIVLLGHTGTQLRDSSYPIHGDIGPVVDSTEG